MKSFVKRFKFSFLIYFVVMLVIFSPTSVSADIQDEITLLQDGSSLNISFVNYNVTMETSEVMDQVIMLLPMTSVTVNINEIPSSIKFVLLQAHSFLYNVTLSYSKALTQHMYINGTDIGLVQILGFGQRRAQFVLYNDNINSNASVLIAAQGYGGDAPVPGGCNMEFDVEIAGTLSVSYTDALVRVESQPAATPLATPPPRSCEMTQVEMELYHLFLPERDFSMEAYFQAIRSLMTVDDVRRNGRKVEMTLEGSPMRRYYSSYPGTGTAYAVLAVTEVTGSAYVPAVTYACNNVYWTDSCEVLTSVFSKLLCAIILFVGFFTCFFGHRFFKCEMFLFGFLTAGFVAYIVLTREGSLDASATSGLSVIAGLGFGSLWVLFWCCFGLPIMSVSLATLSLGFLVASIIMHAGLADVAVFEVELNFWVVFLSITLSTAIVCLTEIHRASVVCSAVVGSFAVVVPVDHYVGGSVRYLLTNSMRRATVEEFRRAVIDPPFQYRDIILVSMWFGLASLGMVFQFYQHQGKPPFPAPPCRGGRARARAHRADTDRTPLMGDASSAYGSVSTGPDSVFETPASPRRFTFLPKFPVGGPVARNGELF